MSTRCEQIVEATRYLESVGLSRDQLSQLHHFARKGRPISFALVYSYFGESKDLQERNSRFGDRLAYVARERRAGRRDLNSLIAEALKAWPL